MSHFLSDENTTKAERIKYRNLLNTNCNQLLSIVENILDYSQIQDKQTIALTLEKHVLRETFNRVINEFKNKCEVKNLQFIVELDPLLKEQTGYYDEKRLYQSLSHILDNAIKFTHQGQVKIAVTLIERITNKITIQISISDTGIGIDPNQLEALGKPFAQADNSLTRKFSGIGMGLVLSQKIIKSMNSQLLIDSTPNKGSTLIFNLTIDTAKRSFDSKALNLSGKIGLLVEDNPVNIQIMKLLLAKWHMQIDIATDGLQAVNLLKQNKSTYHIIFMDLHMPIMDGLQATQIIREDGLFSGPILAVSAETQASVINSLPNKGFNDFIAKPISPKDLVNKLNHYL